MSVLHDVFGSLGTMSLLQLLLAFTACMSYALAQGRLLGRSGGRVAWVAACGGAGGFVLMNREWTSAVVLVAVAIVGLGLFNALVWLTSRLIGIHRQPAPEASAAAATASAAAPPEAARHPIGGTIAST